MSDAESAGRAPETPLTAQVNDSILIRDLPVGSQIKLRDGSTAEVTANPGDGGWLFVRFVESPQRPERVGTEDMVFCIDVVDHR